MKGALRVASALSRFNLFYWGLTVVTSLYGSIKAFNPMNVTVTVIIASFPLHAYAALQLHRSIRHPELPLSHNSPTGIRFVGSIVLCLGALFLLVGAGFIGYTRELVDFAKERKMEVEGLGPWTERLAREIGGILIVFGLIAVVNVILNFRLLRWYYLVHKSDAP